MLSILSTLRLWSRVGSVMDQTTGETFSSWDALTHGGLSLPLAGCVCIAIGVGIWEERPWSRHLMIAYWIMSFATGVGRATTINGLSVALTTTIFTGIFVLTGWYLYAKENVVAYYKSLEMRGRVGVTRAPDDL